VDKISKEKRSELMSAIRSKNTKPEVALRKTLFAKGCRYRIHYGALKIDIAFPKKKVAIFVDGCFWHGCPLHSHLPKSNKEYWVPKLTKNKIRDIETTKQLENEGWLVLRFWEHELKSDSEISDRIIVKLSKRNCQDGKINFIDK
jgi:DNA mismatch endonuclease (patch repair protein)